MMTPALKQDIYKMSLVPLIIPECKEIIKDLEANLKRFPPTKEMSLEQFLKNDYNGSNHIKYMKNQDIHNNTINK